MRSRRLAALAGCVVLLAAVTPLGAQQPQDRGWRTVDYAEVLDRRELTHSGESVETLLAGLEGRPLPAGGERPGDRLAHVLIEPLLEKYAFLLSDVLDAGRPLPGAVWSELGARWDPGEAQPAWVELLRAGRYVVEENGRGGVRAILPWSGQAMLGPDGAPLLPAARAGEEAWRDAWPVLRYVLADVRAATKVEALDVEVHAYVSMPERVRFALAVEPHRLQVERTRLADAPAAAAAGLEAFVSEGWRLEGGRLLDGRLELVGSQRADGGRLLDAPLDGSDLAVAYRAVFHGGLAEPYMSLDRGPFPHTSAVNYGGRLRDTRLGWVSLLCDVRFKTFSLGLGAYEGRDLREELRARWPDFRSHVERFAGDPGSRNVFSQQSRLWFYPDRVDLTVSPELDAMLMRRVRMAAASERVAEGTLTGTAPGPPPPWTRATIEAVNGNYDALAARFDELAGLDETVRLLALFTWLREAQSAGRTVPGLEALLARRLPAAPTPRRFPQMLSYNILPQPGADGPIAALDRLALADAFERLGDSAGGGGDPAARFGRARGALDPADARQSALAAEMDRVDPARLPGSLLDLYSYRAERLRMHAAVLASLPDDERAAWAGRYAAPGPRVFSVAIGGIDLGTRAALRRERAASLKLGGRGAAAVGAPARPSRPQAAPVAAESRGIEARPIPRVAGETRGRNWQRRSDSRLLQVWNAGSPEFRARRAALDAQGRVAAITRWHGSRRIDFRVERAGSRVRLAARPALAADPGGSRAPQRLPDGLAVLESLGPRRIGEGGPHEREVLGLRLTAGADGPVERNATLARPAMQRWILGPRASRGETPPPLTELPEALGAAGHVMVLLPEGRLAAPWEDAVGPASGEEDSLQLARALSEWHRAGALAYAPVVGFDGGRSADRWASAPAPGRHVPLVLPEDAFPAPFAAWRDRLAAGWSAGPVAASVGAAPKAARRAGLVVVVGAESPGVFADRLLAMARDPAMEGRLLAAWNLAAPLRDDLPARLLESGGLAGVGIARGSVVALREAADGVAGFSEALAGPRSGRADSTPSPFVWFY